MRTEAPGLYSSDVHGAGSAGQYSWGDNLHDVSIRVPHLKSLGKPQHPVRQCTDRGRDELHRSTQGCSGGFHIGTANVVCQCQRSVGCESVGNGLPAAGSSYSKNSTPGGPIVGARPVTRALAPGRLSRCSYSAPMFNVLPAMVRPNRSR